MRDTTTMIFSRSRTTAAGHPPIPSFPGIKFPFSQSLSLSPSPCQRPRPRRGQFVRNQFLKTRPSFSPRLPGITLPNTPRFPPSPFSICINEIFLGFAVAIDHWPDVSPLMSPVKGMTLVTCVSFEGGRHMQPDAHRGPPFGNGNAPFRAEPRRRRR